MKKYIAVLIICLFPFLAFADVDEIEGTATSTVDTIEGSTGHDTVEGQAVAAAGGFCASQSWEDYTEFRFDGDHTTDAHYACIDSGETTETLTDNNSVTIATPGQASLAECSGGDAILANADDEYVVGDNTNAYFTSNYGSMKVCIMLDGETGALGVVQAVDSNSDYLYVWLDAGGRVDIIWRSSGGTAVVLENLIDLEDGSYSEWTQIYAYWDTENADASDQLCATYRTDADQNGVWDAAFATPHTCDGAAVVDAFGTEPSTDDIRAGIVGTYTSAVHVDGLQFTPDRPAAF